VADVPGPARDAAIGRLLRWYMRTVDAAATAVAPHRYNMPLEPVGADPAPLSFAEADDALSWYDSERANVVAATRQASASGLHDIAWRLPAPLTIVFESRQNWADLITTHRIALDSARRVGNRQGEAWLLNSLGVALGYTGNGEGIDCLEQALDIRREIGDRRGEAQAANNLADTYQRLGRPQEALDPLWRALDLNRDVGYRYGEGVALVNLGDVLLQLDRADEAIDCLQQARRTFAEIEDADGAGFALYLLGRSYLSLGGDAEALNCLRQALTSHQTAGNRHRQAITLRLLGRAQARNDLAAEARESWAQAAAIFDDLGDNTQAAEVRAELITSAMS
jgi:tetratricopeptide (TPR) repeat protein